jgi:hypothetical protein
VGSLVGGESGDCVGGFGEGLDGLGGAGDGVPECKGCVF